MLSSEVFKEKSDVFISCKALIGCINPLNARSLVNLSKSEKAPTKLAMYIFSIAKTSPPNYKLTET
ncbi:hypothetical protein D3C73_1252930 [compost metagenome]